MKIKECELHIREEIKIGLLKSRYQLNAPVLKANISQ